ncbi:MAG: hypothetical protein Fur0018_26440 [Anaerolineales bacterium]
MARREYTQRRVEWRGFYEEFQSRSDRASAIVGAAFLDGHLGHLLRSFFIDDSEAAETLLGVERPLESFGSRIRLCYVLGLISEDEYQDLQVILNVRNIFANEMRGVSFDDAEIKALCRSLRMPDRVMLPAEDRSARNLFVFATALLAQTIMLRAADADAHRRQRPKEFSFVPEQ